MAFSISPAKAEDVDLLVRKVDYPAHQDNPLYRLMFPRSKEQWELREDMVYGLKSSIHQVIILCLTIENDAGGHRTLSSLGLPLSL